MPLVEGEYTLETVVDEEQAGSHATAMLPGGGFVVLDTDVSPELELEGAARDVVRAVQQARRHAALEVSDRISLEITGADFVHRAVLAHRDLVTRETLAVDAVGRAGPRCARPSDDGVSEVVVGERYRARLRVTKH